MSAQIRLRFFGFQSIETYGTAAPHTSQAKATTSIFATQKGDATICCGAPRANQAADSERICSGGVNILINTALRRGVNDKLGSGAIDSFHAKDI
ncbi:MAG: hypothetical protein DME59_01600 [Verrucomicrobia bacterium]|nr:MAG: hypothetical protein DME59_01600 [Verrucomicrobiota bacterium]PYL77473.1 MAG: hypothetical protein DMF26_03920 [Verrucomicrobiota bacterium]